MLKRVTLMKAYIIIQKESRGKTEVKQIEMLKKSTTNMKL